MPRHITAVAVQPVVSEDGQRIVLKIDGQDMESVSVSLSADLFGRVLSSIAWLAAAKGHPVFVHAPTPSGGNFLPQPCDATDI